MLKLSYCEVINLINRVELKKKAKFMLKGNARNYVPIAIIFIYTSALLSFSEKNLGILFRHYRDIFPVISSIVLWVLQSVFVVGIISFCLNIACGRNSEITDFFDQFEHTGKFFLLSLVKNFFIFLWGLLLIVPGFIAYYRYSMAEYIIAENPDISISDAIKQSKEMMNGKKGKLFILDLTFLGWTILTAVTGGLAGLYAIPYIFMSRTLFYLNVKQEYMDEQAFRKAWNEKKQQSEGGNPENSDTENNGTENSNTNSNTYFTDERKKREMENHTWSHNN